jgi:hypothetical protein
MKKASIRRQYGDEDSHGMEMLALPDNAPHVRPVTVGYALQDGLSDQILLPMAPGCVSSNSVISVEEFNISYR